MMLATATETTIRTHLYRLAIFVALCLISQPLVAEEGSVSAEDREAATRAYDALIDDANARFAKAQEEKTEGIELALMEDFEKFAQAHPGTEEAVIAWIQSAMLARMGKDFDRAEKNLGIASTLTNDPNMEGQIRSERANLMVRPGQLAPEFQLTTVDGRTLSNEDLRGKVYLLDFWATWCGPCIAELPNLKQVYADYHPKGLEVVSISLDSDRPTFDSFIQENEMSWTHVYQDDQASDADITERYGVVSIPRMILVGTDGVVIESNLRGHALGEAVKQALEG